MGVDVPVGVLAGVGVVVDRKGRRQVGDGMFDSAANQWAFVSGRTVFPAAYADRKAADQAGSLRALKPK